MFRSLPAAAPPANSPQGSKFLFSWRSLPSCVSYKDRIPYCGRNVCGPFPQKKGHFFVGNAGNSAAPHAFLKESLAKNFVRNCVSLLCLPHNCPDFSDYCVGAGVLTGPPITNPLLRLVATGALSSSSRTAFSPFPGQRQRRGSGGNPVTTRAGVTERSSGKRPPSWGSGGKPTWRTGRLAAGPIAASPGDSFVPF